MKSDDPHPAASPPPQANAQHSRSPAGGRRVFLQHFVICLGVAGAGAFSWLNGVPQAVFAADASMMTSAIFVWFVVSAVALGRAAWRGDAAGAAFGHFAVRMSVLMGILGTAVGLSLQAKALIGGSAAFGALATSLYTTMTGAAAALGIEVMTFNLEGASRDPSSGASRHPERMRSIRGVPRAGEGE